MRTGGKFMMPEYPKAAKQKDFHRKLACVAGGLGEKAKKVESPSVQVKDWRENSLFSRTLGISTFFAFFPRLPATQANRKLAGLAASCFKLFTLYDYKWQMANNLLRINFSEWFSISNINKTG